MIRESDIERHLVNTVKQRGGIAYKFVSPARRNVPDRIVLLPGGQIIFVECKAPGKKPTAGQLREHERIQALGFKVLIVDSYDTDEVFNANIKTAGVSKDYY